MFSESDDMRNQSCLQVAPKGMGAKYINIQVFKILNKIKILRNIDIKHEYARKFKMNLTFSGAMN